MWRALPANCLVGTTAPLLSPPLLTPRAAGRMACRGALARPRAPHPPALLQPRRSSAAAAAAARPPRRAHHARRAALPTRAAATPIGCVYRAVAVPSLEPPYDTISLRVRVRRFLWFAAAR